MHLHGYLFEGRDVLKLVEMGRQLYGTLPEIRILAIQPGSMDMGMKLSELLENKLKAYAMTAVKEIGR